WRATCPRTARIRSAIGDIILAHDTGGTGHGSTPDHTAPSLARRRGRRRRPQQAGRRADPAGAVTRAGRPSGAGGSRSGADAGPVSRRRVGVRPADGAALLTAQHAGLPLDRADLAPE